MHLFQLNNRLLVRIFALASLDSWLALTLVCHQFRKFIEGNEALFCEWCVGKYPEHIDRGRPLPKGTNYEWMAKCLYKSLRDGQDRKPKQRYGHWLSSKTLWIRSSSGAIDVGIDIRFKPEIYQCGTFVSRWLQGEGCRIESDESYSGELVGGDYQGFGKLVYSNGDTYTGYFVESKRKGFGTCTWANGESYSGQWDDDVLQGSGTYTWPDGTTYTGQFVNEHASGFGTLKSGSYQKSYACITDDEFDDDVDKYEDDEDNLPDGKYGWLHYNCEPHWKWICDACYLRDHSQCRMRRMWTPLNHLVLECGCSKPNTKPNTKSLPSTCNHQ